jgi:hypothetical protein
MLEAVRQRAANERDMVAGSKFRSGRLLAAREGRAQQGEHEDDKFKSHIVEA